MAKWEGRQPQVGDYFAMKVLPPGMLRIPLRCFRLGVPQDDMPIVELRNDENGESLRVAIDALQLVAEAGSAEADAMRKEIEAEGQAMFARRHGPIQPERAPEPEKPFEPGDVVQLLTAGPEMVVLALQPTVVLVTWFVGSQPITTQYPPEALVRVRTAAEQREKLIAEAAERARNADSDDE